MSNDLTTLYRHFNASGELLYVGISINAFDRFKQHSRDKAWIDDVSNMTIERFPTRQAALNAETYAIVNEHPKYNIANNPLADKNYQKRDKRNILEVKEVKEEIISSDTIKSMLKRLSQAIDKAGGITGEGAGYMPIWDRLVKELEFAQIREAILL